MVANHNMRIFGRTDVGALTRVQFSLLAMKSTLDHIMATKGKEDEVFLNWL